MTRFVLITMLSMSTLALADGNCCQRRTVRKCNPCCRPCRPCNPLQPKSCKSCPVQKLADLEISNGTLLCFYKMECCGDAEYYTRTIECPDDTHTCKGGNCDPLYADATPTSFTRLPPTAKVSPSAGVTMKDVTWINASADGKIRKFRAFRLQKGSDNYFWGHEVTKFPTGATPVTGLLSAADPEADTLRTLKLDDDGDGVFELTETQYQVLYHHSLGP